MSSHCTRYRNPVPVDVPSRRTRLEIWTSYVFPSVLVGPCLFYERSTVGVKKRPRGKDGIRGWDVQEVFYCFGNFILWVWRCLFCQNTNLPRKRLRRWFRKLRINLITLKYLWFLLSNSFYAKREKERVWEFCGFSSFLVLRRNRPNAKLSDRKELWNMVIKTYPGWHVLITK